jgi:hypothetical protein
MFVHGVPFLENEYTGGIDIQYSTKDVFSLLAEWVILFDTPGCFVVVWAVTGDLAV